MLIGDRVGPYEVLGKLGEGGMGAVYRATDTKLKRQVAIKILPPAVAADAERLARFQREAEVLASLNHPNIAAIYGLEEGPSTSSGQAGITALVMELVEGDDLSQRLAKGAIPLDEVLPIARQIAESLEAAHEQGIIHRDLKPANIKVRSDGTVKVLDFGLAKAIEGTGGTGRTGRPGGDNVSQMATLTSPALMTGAGMILGTAAYMSPEQARGKTVDKRADIWAFGAVLYEMLTGTRAFRGEDVTDTLALVVRGEPAWETLLPTVPARVRQVLRSCLQKDPRQRLAHMQDVRLAIEGAFETAAPQTPGTNPATARGARVAWMVAGAAALVAVALAVPAVRALREGAPPATRVARLTLGLAPAERLGPATRQGRPSHTAFAVSPDGGTVVFSGETAAPEAGSPRTARLYRRPLAEAEAVAIPGTEGATYPFFSPDGAWVGFAAGNTLKKVALRGGPPIDLCAFTGVGGILDGASWGPAGVITFAARGLWTVADSCGTPEAAVDVEPTTRIHTPAMLPDGQTVLFTAVTGQGQWDAAHVDAINLTTKQRTTLLTNAADARYSPTGHLIFMRNAALLAVPFDATRVAVTGAAVPLLAGVMQATDAGNSAWETGMGQFALSASGTLLYASGGRYPTAASALVRVDRTGAATMLAEMPGVLLGLRLSPAGTRIAAFKTGGDGSRADDIWLYDLPSGTPTRFTSTGDASYPLFSPDGASVMFRKVGSAGGVHTLPLVGGTTPRRVMEGTGDVFAASWSPDGKWLAYSQTVGSVRQIFVRPLREGTSDAGEPRQFSPSTFRQEDGVFSPDGRWIAYTSNESGANEVYVQAFPGPGERRRISSNGGVNPAWSHNGRELFFLVRPVPGRQELSMMAVAVSTEGAFTASAPRRLFTGPYVGSGPLRSYDVTADGQFFMTRIQEPPDEPVTTLHVVLGWAEELQAKMTSGK